jgi:hypothetical protein
MKDDQLFIPVNSSNIKEVLYSEKERKLFVKFWTEAVYSYHPIQPEAYNELIKAESVGKYFNDNIKTNPNVTVTCEKEKPKK